MTMKSFTARAVSALPPAKRVYDALNYLNASVSALKAKQEAFEPQVEAVRDDLRGLITASITAVRHRQDHVEAQLNALQAEAAAEQAAAAQAAAQQAAAALAQRDADAVAALDSATRRELGEAALRNLPFLPGNFIISDDVIEVVGVCGAPDGLTGRMAFFVNGASIDDVEYPIEDREKKLRLPELAGWGYAFRVRIRENLDALRASRFWRFDAAPNGCYNEADWRRAIHFMNPAMERFAFPPEANIRRVIGDISVERFAMGGAIIFNNAQRYLRELGYGWADFPQILDWGCGAGRLTRYLIGETSSRVTGVDIDSENIEWCRQNYADGNFQTVPLRPKTSLNDGQFNLVFGLSVMTHLQEKDQFLWLEELQRVTAPGAILLLSVQGPTQFAYNNFPPHLYRQVQEVGYLDLQRDDALADVVADTEYYRSAMHSRAYIISNWGKYFEVVGFADAIAGLQDFVILRKRG